MGGFVLLTLLLFLSAGFLFGEKGMKYAFTAWIVFMAISIVTFIFSERTNVGIVFILTVVCSIMATAAIVRRIRKSRIMERIFRKRSGRLWMYDTDCFVLLVFLFTRIYLQAPAALNLSLFYAVISHSFATNK